LRYLDITQHSKDAQVLYYIKSNLGFGRVVFPKNRPHISMFIINDQKQIEYIISLISTYRQTQRFIPFINDPEMHTTQMSFNTS